MSYVLPVWIRLNHVIAHLAIRDYVSQALFCSRLSWGSQYLGLSDAYGFLMVALEGSTRESCDTYSASDHLIAKSSDRLRTALQLELSV